MRTLVLNAGYEPLAIVSFKRALVLVMNDKATVIERVDGDPVWGIRGVRASGGHRAHPLCARAGEPAGAAHTPRRAAPRRSPLRLLRQGATTIDHVLPRSRGGADSWENLVACCLRCNNVKGDRTPQEMNWELRWTPQPPRGGQWIVRGTERADPTWEPYLSLAA